MKIMDSQQQQVFVEDYIQKITLLERQVGDKFGYQILEPFSVDSRDVIAIQTAAKKIADFVGLHDFTFIVARVKQKENVAGHVELKYGEKEVFIEISDDMIEFEETVLATLAHEITHKYLHVNGISCGINVIKEYENEVLTDISTVFLGLGKLTLNGCECKNVHQEYVQDGTKVITKTLKSGYLSRAQFAFVYRLVCAMRKIPSNEYQQGLSSDSIHALQECERYYCYYFDNRFHKPTVRNEYVKHLESEIRKIQSILFNIDKNLLCFQGTCINVVESFLGKTHKRLKRLLVDSQEMVSAKEYDPCQKFLKEIQIEQTIVKLLSELGDYSTKASRYQDGTAKLVKYIQRLGTPFLEPNLDMFTIVTCRNDGTKLRLPKSTHMIAKCPKCKYQFVADTSLPVFAKLHDIKKGTRLKRIFKLFMKFLNRSLRLNIWKLNK